MSEARKEEKFHRLVDEVVLGELSPEKWQALRSHLKECASCRGRYDRAVLAERMLHGGPSAASAPSPGELDRIARAVLPPENRSLWSRLMTWVASHRLETAGALATAAAAVLILPLVRGTGTHTEFQSRGGRGPVELYSTDVTGKMIARTAGLRAFCLHGGQVRALDPKDPLPPGCARGDQLKLAIANPGGFAHVFLFGLDDEHDLKWYAPRPTTSEGMAPGTESVAAPTPAAEQTDLPVGSTVRLGVNHEPGPVRLYALFSDKPVTAGEVEAAANELAKLSPVGPCGQRRAGCGVAADVPLPLKRSDVLQRSLLIDVQP